MKVGITLSEQEILKCISQYGSKTGYELGKETKYSQKTSYQGVKNLVDEGLLSVSIVGKTRAGMDKKAYSLTVLGFSFALAYTVLEEYRSIVERWPDLIPLVTGKWNVFVDAGVEVLATHRLKSAALTLVRESQREFMLSWVTPIESKTIDEIFTGWFYYYSSPLLYDREERWRWAKACTMDAEVRDYIIEKLKMVIEEYEIMVHEAEVTIQVLQGKDV